MCAFIFFVGHTNNIDGNSSPLVFAFQLPLSAYAKYALTFLRKTKGGVKVSKTSRKYRCASLFSVIEIYADGNSSGKYSYLTSSIAVKNSNSDRKSVV